MNSNVKVTLNVGGTKVQTFKSTLEQLEYFKVLFKSNFNKEEEIFLDCDYNIFIHVLNKIRDAAYKYPSNLTTNDLENILKMENYYSMTITKNKVSTFFHLSATSSSCNDTRGVNQVGFKRRYYSEYHIRRKIFNIMLNLKSCESNLICFRVTNGPTTILDCTNWDIPIFCTFEKVTSNYFYCIKKEVLDIINSNVDASNDRSNSDVKIICNGDEIEPIITCF